MTRGRMVLKQVVDAAGFLCIFLVCLPFIPCILCIPSDRNPIARSAEQIERENQDHLRNARHGNPPPQMDRQRGQRRLSLSKSEDPDHRGRSGGGVRLTSGWKRTAKKVGGYDLPPLKTDSSLLSKLPLELRRSIYQEILGGKVLHIHYQGKDSKALMGHTECRYVHCRHRSCSWNRPIYRRDTGAIAPLEEILSSHTECIECNPAISAEFRLMPLNPPPKPRKDRSGNPVTQTGLLALLLTCQQVYSEAIDILYSQNVFEFQRLHTMIEFSCSILPRRLAAIRSIQYEWLAPGPPHSTMFLSNGLKRLEIMWQDGMVELNRAQYDYGIGNVRARHTIPPLKEIRIVVREWRIGRLDMDCFSEALQAIKEVVVAANIPGTTIVVDYNAQVERDDKRLVDVLADAPFVLRTRI